MATPIEVFETAKQDFEAQLSEKQIDRFSQLMHTGLHDVKTQIIKIQHEQISRKTMMNFNRYRSFIEAFEQFEEVCKVVEVEVEDLSGYLWGPCRWILSIIKEEPKVLDCVLEGYFKLGQQLPLVTQYKSQLRELPEMTKILAWMYYDLLKFYGRILKMLATPSWKKTFVVDWKDYEKSFQAILQTFVHHANTLKQLLDNQQYRNLETLQNRNLQHSQDSLRRMNDHMLRYQDDREDLLRHIAMYEKDRQDLIDHTKKQENRWKDEQYRDVSAWLRSPGDAKSDSVYHDEFRAIHSEYPNTGGWIFNEDKVESWINADPPTHSVLWVNGKKGAGKTILASVIIDHLKEKKTEFATTYFYCRETNERVGESRFLAICKSLLRQLTNQNRDLLPTLYEKRMSGGDRLNDETIAKSLIELFSYTSMKQFIVIDGLDELSENPRKILVSFLTSIVSRSDTYDPGKIRLLLISTDLADMRKLVQADDNVQVYEVQPQDTEKDIRKYVSKEFVELKSQFNLQDDELELAQHRICANARGMFLYAHLVVENLRSLPTLRYFLSELKEENLPKELSEVYQKIIQRLREDVHQKTWEEARRIFGWMACAERPLKEHELQAILSMEVDQHGQTQFFFRTHRLCQDIRTVCGPLVYVVGGNRIEFIHQTAKEFIMQTEELNWRSLQCEMAFLCLSYLSHECFGNDLGANQRRRNAELGYYAFQDYAISMWNFHLTSITERHADLLGDPAQHIHRMTLKIMRGFYVRHEHGLRAPPRNQRESTDKHEEMHISNARERCQALQQHHDLFKHLTEIFAHINRHYAQKIKESNQVSIEDLKKALNENRTTIQALANDKTSVIKVSDYYGDKHYKCSRVNCVFFYEGLEDEDQLKKHSDRHERPYSCLLRDCYMVPFGFSSNKDRDKHVRMYHSELVDQPEAFPQLAVRQTKFQCNLCHKSFTRGGILQEHIDAHLGRRPYPCSTCGREFTRQNDRRRHEKTRHVRRR